MVDFYFGVLLDAGRDADDCATMPKFFVLVSGSPADGNRPNKIHAPNNRGMARDDMGPEAGAGQTIVFLTTVLAKNVDSPMGFGDFVGNVNFSVFPQQHSRGCALAHRSRGKKRLLSLGFHTGFLAGGGNLAVFSVIIFFVYLPACTREHCSPWVSTVSWKTLTLGGWIFLGRAAESRNVLVL